jgi:prepilin-type N-terminal cleavage/methylation domain-containing protein
MKSTAKAFSLIEMLVVIGIIAVLATIVAVATSAVRIKTHDQARMTDLNNIYRFLGTAGGGSIASYWPDSIADDGDLNELLNALSVKFNTKFFSQAPRDPSAATQSESGYRYRYNNGNLVIYANLEKKDTPPTLLFNEPTPAGGRGVFVGTGAWANGINGTDRYYQVSN